MHSGLEPSHHSRSIIHGVPILKLAEAAETISQVPNESWNTTPLHNAIFQLVISMTEVGALSDNHLKAGQTALDLDQRGYSKALYSYLRWALAGGMPGPGVADIMTILGRRVTLSRLRDAAESVRGHAAGGVDAEVLQNEAIVPE